MHGQCDISRSFVICSYSLKVIFPPAEHHCPLAGAKLYCLMTEAHEYEQPVKVVTSSKPAESQSHEL